MSLIAPLFETPHTFAIVGASQDKSKYGYEVFETLTRHGHIVLLINPKYAQIDGVPCYPSLADLPQKPDVVLTAALNWRNASSIGANLRGRVVFF
ncbi:MAG: hypothetical protein Fur0043_26500 [Anaerolineales bacterium]